MPNSILELESHLFFSGKKRRLKNENGGSCGKLTVPDVVMVVDPFVDVFPVSNRHLRLLKLRKMWAIDVDII